MPHGQYPDADKGKCRSCGFLSKHAKTAEGWPAPRFYEVEHAERESADGYRRYMAAKTEPMCFLGKINLQAVLQEEGDERLVKAILADRKCDAWAPYMPGLSPIEHYEDFRMQRLEQDRREFNEHLARRDEEVHTALVQAQQSFQLERERAQEPTTKLMRRLTWLAVGLAAIQVAIGLTPESLIVKAFVKLWRLIFG